MKIIQFLIFNFFVATASGLSCSTGDFARLYDAADVVILVTATEATHNNGEPELTKLRIKENLKERYSNTAMPVNVTSEKSESREQNSVYLLQPAFRKTPLNKDKDYVIFGKNTSVGVITSNVCSGNFPLDYVYAKQKLSKLRKLKLATREFNEP